MCNWKLYLACLQCWFDWMTTCKTRYSTVCACHTHVHKYTRASTVHVACCQPRVCKIQRIAHFRQHLSFTVLTSEDHFKGQMLQLRHETDRPEKDIKLLRVSWLSDKMEREAFAFPWGFFVVFFLPHKLSVVKSFGTIQQTLVSWMLFHCVQIASSSLFIGASIINLTPKQWNKTWLKTCRRLLWLHFLHIGQRNRGQSMREKKNIYI